MKKIILVMVICLITSATSYSEGFQKERIWLGPTVGYGFTSIGFGATGEYAISNHFGIGFDFAYSGFREDLPKVWGMDNYFEHTFLGMLASCSYHFMPNKKFDPFVKAGIGYFYWDSRYFQDGKEITTPLGKVGAFSTGIGITGLAGMRYHLSDQFSLRGCIGYPFIISAGVDIAFGESSTGESRKSSTPKVKDASSYESDNADTLKVPKKKRDKFSILGGMYLGGKASINTVNPDGRKNAVGSGIPDIGISSLLPFEKNGNIGFLLNLGLDRYSYTTKPYDSKVANDLNTITEHYNYINLSPCLYLGGFVIGFNFGFPASAYAKNNDGYEVTVLDDRGIDNVFNLNSLDMSDYMTTLIEVKLGGNIPLVATNFGTLFFNIMASYTLSGVYDNPKTYMYSYEKNTDTGVTESKSDLNPTPVSLSLGISYLFKFGL